MEQALMAVCKDIRLGKILIQTNHDTGEPEVGRPLHMCRCFNIHQTLAGFTTLAVFPILRPAAPLPPSAQRHQRGLRHPDGQHRVHRSRCSHGRQSAAGASTFPQQTLTSL